MSITAPAPAAGVGRRYLDVKEERVYLKTRLENLCRPIKAGYSDVHCAYLEDKPGNAVAVKHPKYTMDNAQMNELMDAALEKEFTILKRVRHPHILPFIGLVRYLGDPCIVTPWMKNGSLRHYLKTWPDADRLGILRDVALALEYLHRGAELPETSNVIHGDIHAGNVLISDEGKALLADFGLSKLVPLNDRASLSLRLHDKAHGVYLAPELHDTNALRSLCSDVFAYGMLIYETYAGIQPNVPVDKLLSGQRPERASIPRNDMTDAVWLIACACWAHSPSDRPSMREVITMLRQAPGPDMASATNLADTPSIWDGAPLERPETETKGCDEAGPELYLQEDMAIPGRPLNVTNESEVYRAHYTYRPDDVVAVRRMRYGATHPGETPLTNTAFGSVVANGERDEDPGVEVHRAETGRISGCRAESGDPGEPNTDFENGIDDRESVQDAGAYSHCIPCAEKGRSTCECRSDRPSIDRPKRVRVAGFFPCPIWRSSGVEMPVLSYDGLPGLLHKGLSLLHSPREIIPSHVEGTSEMKPSRVVIHDLTPFITIERDRPFAISPCSDLYKVTLLENIPVIVRRIRFQDDETTNEPRLRDAAAILVKTQHINVLNYIGTCEFDGNLCIVSVFAAGGGLRKHLAAHPDCDRMSLLTQVARGVLYLHQSGIVHGSLHPGNVLLSEDGTVKVSDFGLADIIPDEGSPLMPPAFARERAMHRAAETYMGHALCSSSDVYSFAMLVFHAYSDKEPMIERYPDAMQVGAALIARKRPLRVEISRSDFSENLWVLVQRCWTAEKEKRPSMSAVLEAISKETPTFTAL